MPKEQSEALAPLAPDWQAIVVAVTAEIPTVEEDPTEKMLATIAAAGSAEEIEAMFETTSTKRAIGKQYRIRDVRWGPSRFDNRTGIFIICDAVNLATGESEILVTGSDVSVLQLLKYYQLGILPVDVEVVGRVNPKKPDRVAIRFRFLGQLTGVAEAVG